jgi:hypothetical protein
MDHVPSSVDPNNPVVVARTTCNSAGAHSTTPEGPDSKAAQPGPHIMHPASGPRFQALRAKMESEWTPQMMQLLDLDGTSLPLLWDADFLYGPRTATGDDTYVLCEIYGSRLCIEIEPRHLRRGAAGLRDDDSTMAGCLGYAELFPLEGFGAEALDHYGPSQREESAAGPLSISVARSATAYVLVFPLLREFVLD